MSLASYVERHALFCAHCGSALQTLEQIDARRRLLTCSQPGCKQERRMFEHADDVRYAPTLGDTP